jgi:hypothetical protein
MAMHIAVNTKQGTAASKQAGGCCRKLRNNPHLILRSDVGFRIMEKDRVPQDGGWLPGWSLI